MSNEDRFAPYYTVKEFKARVQEIARLEKAQEAYFAVHPPVHFDEHRIVDLSQKRIRRNS